METDETRSEHIIEEITQNVTEVTYHTSRNGFNEVQATDIMKNIRSQNKELADQGLE